MIGEKDISNDRELTLRNLSLNAIRDLCKGTKDCTYREHLFLSMNNIHNVICLSASCRQDGATHVYEFSLYARPSAVRSVFDVYDDFSREVEPIRDVGVSFQVLRSTDILLTVEIFETVQMDIKRVLSHLLECVNRCHHQVVNEMADDECQQD